MWRNECWNDITVLYPLHVVSQREGWRTTRNKWLGSPKKKDIRIPCERKFLGEEISSFLIWRFQIILHVLSKGYSK